MLRAGILAAAVLTLVLSYQLKRPCLEKPWGGAARLEYALLCYNDIQPLYGVRKLDQRRFPYVVERSYEYPVLIGLVMWLASLSPHDHVSYFLSTLPYLIAMTLLALVGLVGAIGWNGRLLWFAAGSPLLLYAFHNWDLIAVAPLCLAMWAWASGKDGWTGAALGTGAAAKLYPGFLVPALFIARWRGRQRRGAVQILLGAVCGWAIWNLPILAATYIRNGDFSGWLGVFQFHARRFPDFGTLWFWFPEYFRDYRWLPPWVIAIGFLGFAVWLYLGSDRRRLTSSIVTGVLGVIASTLLLLLMNSSALDSGAVSDPYRQVVDRASFLLFAAGTLGLLVLQWRVGRDPWAIGGAIVCLFLSVSKVHSPQYALWVLPFFLVVSTPTWMILGYFIADLALLVTGFWWFVAAPDLGPHLWRWLFAISVYLREAMLLVLLGWYATTARDRLRAHSDRSEIRSWNRSTAGSP